MLPGPVVLARETPVSRSSEIHSCTVSWESAERFLSHGAWRPSHVARGLRTPPTPGARGAGWEAYVVLHGPPALLGLFTQSRLTCPSAVARV